MGPIHIVAGSESSRERKFQGAKFHVTFAVPGSESSTYGTFHNSELMPIMCNKLLKTDKDVKYYTGVNGNCIKWMSC